MTRRIPFFRWLAVAVWLVLPLAAQAHEIGTTHVRFLLDNGRMWSADITTAPTALLNKLEAQAGQPPSRDLNATTLRGKLEPLRDILSTYIEVRFDGVVSPVLVDIAQVDMPTDITKPSFVVIRAHGPAPVGTRRVTWRSGLVYSTYALVFSETPGGSPATQWLDGDAESRPFPIAAAAPPTRLEIAAQYLELGFRHIVPEGLDHILFVLGIFLLTAKLKPILVQVTAFTVAHSVTLGLTMYGVLSLPPRVVEPLIALSIAYVAIENIVTPKLTPWRPAVVFGFGLIHGMGFAGVLTDLHLPHREIVPALVSFNIGIELAQLTVIGLAYFAVAFWLSDKRWYRARVVIPACVAIAATGLFWTVQRIASA
ncbi:MAG: HupE/UreJ family protein [Pseudolabrys sp.]|nr:HupE/UreJ family protein [Pseudolabrys sp.]